MGNVLEIDRSTVECLDFQRGRVLIDTHVTNLIRETMMFRIWNQVFHINVMEEFEELDFFDNDFASRHKVGGGGSGSELSESGDDSILEGDGRDDIWDVVPQTDYVEPDLAGQVGGSSSLNEESFPLVEVGQRGEVETDVDEEMRKSLLACFGGGFGEFVTRYRVGPGE